MKEFNEQSLKDYCYSQKFSLSESNGSSIREADVIEHRSLFKEISFSQSQESEIENERYRIGKKNGQQILELIGNNSRSQAISIIELNGEKEDSGQKKTHQSKSSREGEVLKKINMEKIVKSTANKIPKTVLKLSGSKQKPRDDNQLQIMWEKDENRAHWEIMKNCKTEAIKNFRKERYIKKNYEFEEDIIKICDVKIDEKVCNIKGEILFKWEKQVVHQKWAKTDMVCIEIHDGSDSVIVAIPEKILVKKVWELEVGMWVQLYRVEAKEKYPKKVCMLVTQNSQIKITNRSEIAQELLIQPERLGLSLKQFVIQPIGRICNLVCLVIDKSEKQFIKSFKGNNLVISKISVYDPIDRKLEHIKLWEEKSDLPFYNNATVYLLRGIEIKQFKGLREYQACKDFNYRVLTFSSIESYLRELYEERWQLLSAVPESYHKMRIDECCHVLERKYAKLVRKRQLANSQLTSPAQQEFELGRESSELQSDSRTRKILKSPQRLERLVLIVWSQCIIKFVNFEIEENYQIKYIYCLECKHKAMRSCVCQERCTNCKSEKCVNIYFIKCEFSDGKYNYLGEINERVASKIFAIENQLTKMDFFQQCHINFKRSIIKEIVNVAVRAIIATTKQKISQEVWIYGYYIVDILPFEDLIANSNVEEEENGSKNQNNEKQERSSRDSQDERNKIVRFLK